MRRPSATLESNARDSSFEASALVNATASTGPLAELQDTLVPKPRRFPRMGRRYPDRPPQSAEAIAQLGTLPAGAADSMRLLDGGDELILYAEMNVIHAVRAIPRLAQCA